MGVVIFKQLFRQNLVINRGTLYVSESVSKIETFFKISDTDSDTLKVKISGRNKILNLADDPGPDLSLQTSEPPKF